MNNKPSNDEINIIKNIYSNSFKQYLKELDSKQFNDTTTPYLADTTTSPTMAPTPSRSPVPGGGSKLTRSQKVNAPQLGLKDTLPDALNNNKNSSVTNNYGAGAVVHGNANIGSGTQVVGNVAGNVNATSSTTTVTGDNNKVQANTKPVNTNVNTSGGAGGSSTGGAGGRGGSADGIGGRGAAGGTGTGGSGTGTAGPGGTGTGGSGTGKGGSGGGGIGSGNRNGGNGTGTAGDGTGGAGGIATGTAGDGTGGAGGSGDGTGGTAGSANGGNAGSGGKGGSGGEVKIEFDNSDSFEDNSTSTNNSNNKDNSTNNSNNKTFSDNPTNNSTNNTTNNKQNTVNKTSKSIKEDLIKTVMSIVNGDTKKKLLNEEKPYGYSPDTLTNALSAARNIKQGGKLKSSQKITNSLNSPETLTGMQQFASGRTIGSMAFNPFTNTNPNIEQTGPGSWIIHPDKSGRTYKPQLETPPETDKPISPGQVSDKETAQKPDAVYSFADDPEFKRDMDKALARGASHVFVNKLLRAFNPLAPKAKNDEDELNFSVVSRRTSTEKPTANVSPEFPHWGESPHGYDPTTPEQAKAAQQWRDQHNANLAIKNLANRIADPTGWKAKMKAKKGEMSVVSPKLPEQPMDAAVNDWLESRANIPAKEYPGATELGGIEGFAPALSAREFEELGMGLPKSSPAPTSTSTSTSSRTPIIPGSKKEIEPQLGIGKEEPAPVAPTSARRSTETVGPGQMSPTLGAPTMQDGVLVFDPDVGTGNRPKAPKEQPMDDAVRQFRSGSGNGTGSGTASSVGTVVRPKAQPTSPEMTTSGRQTGINPFSNQAKAGNQTAFQPDQTWDEVAAKYIPDQFKGLPVTRKGKTVYAGDVEMTAASEATATSYAENAPTRAQMGGGSKPSVENTIRTITTPSPSPATSSSSSEATRSVSPGSVGSPVEGEYTRAARLRSEREIEHAISVAKRARVQAEIDQTNAETASILRGMAEPRYTSREQAMYGSGFVKPSSEEIRNRMARMGTDYDSARQDIVRERVNADTAARKAAEEQKSAEESEKRRRDTIAMGRRAGIKAENDFELVSKTMQMQRALWNKDIDPTTASDEVLKQYADTADKAKAERQAAEAKRAAARAASAPQPASQPASQPAPQPAGQSNEEPDNPLELTPGEMARMKKEEERKSMREEYYSRLDEALGINRKAYARRGKGPAAFRAAKASLANSNSGGPGDSSSVEDLSPDSAQGPANPSVDLVARANFEKSKIAAMMRLAQQRGVELSTGWAHHGARALADEKFGKLGG